MGSSLFISMSYANLFLYKLAAISFLASKPGFQQSQPRILNKLNYLKPLPLGFNYNHNSHITHSRDITSAKRYIFNIEYLENKLLEMAAFFKDDAFFRSFIEKDFLHNFKATNSLVQGSAPSPSPFPNSSQLNDCFIKEASSVQTFTQRTYIINLKVVSLYKKLINEYDFFTPSSPTLLESLVLTNFAPSLEAEGIKQEINIHLFKTIINTLTQQATNSIDKNVNNNKMDSLLAYWVTDYLFKLENSSNLDTSINHFNSIVKELENFKFLSSLHPQIFSQILSQKELSQFKLLAPIYQNPRFLQFLCQRDLVYKFKNKVFLLNLSQIYQDYCTQNLSIDTDNAHFMDILTSNAQHQLFLENLPQSKPASNKQKI